MRNNSTGTSGYQQRDVMGVESLRGFYDQRHIPQTFAHHGLPQSGGGQQRGNGGPVRAETPVGEEEESRAHVATQRGRCALSDYASRSRDSCFGRNSKVDFL